MNLGSLVGYLGLDTDDFDKGLGRAESGLGDFAKRSAVKAAAAGAAIAGALGAAVVEGMDVERANDKLAAQLGAGSPLAEAAGEVAGRLYADAYGESLSEVNEAVRSVLQAGLLPEDATNAQIEGITAKVLDLSATFDQDLGGATRAVGQLLRTGLAKDADEALDVITRGFQQGADTSGDYLDTINEYSVQFQKLGLDAGEATGLISQGMKAGARDSDIVADALKEFSIRAIDGSKTTVDGFTSIGLSAGRMAERIGEGGDSAQTALFATLEQLRNMEDPVARDAAAVALFGTQAEDLGAALFALDTDTAVQSLGNVEGAASKMGDALNDNASTNLESFKRQATEAFVDLVGGKVLPVVSDVVSALTTNFGPAVSGAAEFLRDDLAPALQTAAEWIEANRDPILIITGLIAAVFIPHLVALATAATINAAKVVVAWVVTQAGAVAAAGVHSAQIAFMIARWVVLAAASVVQAAVVATAWATGIVASAVAGAASFAVQVARVVGSWVLMGTQSLIQAARVAAAWVIAMGPIGWVIAAVVGLVALIIANWDTVKRVTGQVWDWVVVKVVGAAAGLAVAVRRGIDDAVGFVTGLPGRSVAALGNLGSFLLSAGGDLIAGFLRGIRNRAGEVASAAVDAAKAAVRGVKDFLGIRSPSRVFVGLGENVGQGFVNGIASMQPAVAAEIQRMANYSALASIRAEDGSLVNAGFYGPRPAGEPATVNRNGVRVPLSEIIEETRRNKEAREAAAARSAQPAEALVKVGTVNLVEGTVEDVARKLAVEMRVGGMGA